MREVVEALLEVLSQGQRGALATVVRTQGSTPNRPGARLLLRADDTLVGTIGGGAVEQCVLEALRGARDTGTPQLLVRDLGHELGMCCGGRMEIFVEPVEARPRLFVFGAGHVAKAAVPLARSVGFDVTVVDEREELNTEERFPSCQREVRDPTAVLRRTQLREQDWLLIVTHDHQLDEQTLELALDQPARYIGVVGSRRKVFRLIQRITEKRGAPAFERIYAPVGLDLGSIGPEEIAVSIVAELIALRRGKSVPHLRALDDPRLLQSLGAAREGEE
ncbi:MAG TPA: XdhC family protein [Polyangiaceae bacterium]|nr:XdhC family protein [Polyangiaceae bacterium]